MIVKGSGLRVWRGDVYVVGDPSPTSDEIDYETESQLGLEQHSIPAAYKTDPARIESWTPIPITD